jgi:enoyl-CoA hydratase
VITTRNEGGTAVVTLSHGRVNALDLELLQELVRVMTSLTGADAVVLTGEGSSFCAGVDLRQVLDGRRPYLEQFLPALSEAFLAVFEHPRPVVAAANGHAIAGGCVLVTACDVRLMARGRISLNELRVGVPLPVAAMEVMRHRVPAQLHTVLMSGAAYEAADAERAGLVDAVPQEGSLLETALAEAAQLAAIPRQTFAMSKAQVQAPARERIERLDADWAPQVLDAWSDPVVLDAIAAQLEGLRR